MGKKKQPIYKVVAADSRSPRDGKFIEAIGLYNPLTDPSTVEIKEDRALYWLEKGAQPTDTVKNILSKKGIILKRELARKGLSEDKVQAELEKWEKLQEAKVKSGASKQKKADVAVSPEKADQEVENNETSTAEVKGAASDENTEKQEEQ